MRHFRQIEMQMQKKKNLINIYQIINCAIEQFILEYCIKSLTNYNILYLIRLKCTILYSMSVPYEFSS